VINAWRQLDGFASITDSSYGRWLIVKLVLVAVVVAAAAVSRWQLRQRTVAAPILAASTVGAASAETPPEENRGLRRSVTVELVGMAAVLVATVGLVNSPPPRATAAEQAAEPVTVTATQGNWEAEVDLIPAQTGGTTMHVFLFPLDGSQDVADEIAVTATLPAEDLGPIEIPTVYIPPNHATTDDADFPVAGTWEITVTARFGEFDQVVFTMTADIR
jgi:copper transport protein